MSKSRANIKSANLDLHNTWKKRKFDIGTVMVSSIRQRIKTKAQKVLGSKGQRTAAD